MSNFINVKNFKKWIQEKDLERKTIEGFWENFNSWKEEYPEEYVETFKQGFKPDKLSIYINTVSFTITNYPDENFNHVVIRLNFEYDDSVIGEYRMVLIMKQVKYLMIYLVCFNSEPFFNKQGRLD